MNSVDYSKYLSNDTLAIFLFHGVIEKNDYSVRNYMNKHIEKDIFYQILKDLKENGKSLSMDELVEYHCKGESYPPNSFIISFDDGFENNYSIAAPILESLKIPAIFYITTGWVQNNIMGWSDRIEYCLENTHEVNIFLPWDNKKYFCKENKEKISLMNDIRYYLKNNQDIDCNSFVSEIFSQCQITEIFSNNDPLDLKLNWKQLVELNENDLFIIGGHSHQHLILSFLNDSALNAEIKTSIELLKQNSKINVKHYSYPEGQENHYSQKVINCLKNNGIVCCPTACEGTNKIENDLFLLKRIMVW